jgi:hypothetical protein
VGTGHAAKRENERNEDRTCRNRVREKSETILPPASRSAMIPEPMTVATRKRVPTNSAVTLLCREQVVDMG